MADIEWPHYAADAAGTRYSPAAVVTVGNVRGLSVAWQVRAGDLAISTEGGDDSGARDLASLGATIAGQRRFETTPVMREGTLYFVTPFGRVIALDPANGARRWTFDSHLDRLREYAEGFTSRGVAVWVDQVAAERTFCSTRVFVPIVDARIVALDGAHGSVCTGFGEGGEINLAKAAGVGGRDVTSAHLSVTSPPTIIGDLIVVGSAVRETDGLDQPSGVVRAFDVRTGALRWAFDPIPREPRHPAWRSWLPGTTVNVVGANVWSLISADTERDLVFLPTSSASPDYYGGNRLGRNDLANSVVALRASTGAHVWSFQIVHHDLWDYDVAAQPLLATLRRPHGDVATVIVGTKTGMIFVLDRETGKPVFPIEEKTVPTSSVPGESAWPTQPYAVHPPPLLGTHMTADSVFGLNQVELAFCRNAMRDLRTGGLFTPPSLQGTLEWPGFWGGINWDGMAWDPVRQRLFTTLKRVGMVVRLHRRGDSTVRGEVERGMAFLAQPGSPYVVTRGPLVAPSGTPCTPPPWSTLTAVDFRGPSPGVQWSSPLGSVPWLSGHRQYRQWGSLAFGGPLVTRGGLAFVAASQDDRIHAFDVETGRLLWEHQLPGGGQASPMSYVLNGRQYVVVAAGGRGGIGTPGDWIVAFALPE